MSKHSDSGADEAAEPCAINPLPHEMARYWVSALRLQPECVVQLERASRLTVEFDGVSWALCHDRTPFIEMALTGISLTNLRNRDQSGEPACLATSRLTSSLLHMCWPT